MSSELKDNHQVGEHNDANPHCTMKMLLMLAVLHDDDDDDNVVDGDEYFCMTVGGLAIQLHLFRVSSCTTFIGGVVVAVFVVVVVCWLCVSGVSGCLVVWLACMPACLHACMPACLLACLPACLPACLRACLLACLPT